MGLSILPSLKLLLLFIVAARAALTIDWPPTIVQNTQALVTWQGEAPFDFAVFSVDNATNVHTQIFQLLTTNDTGVQWTANVASGTTVFFFVSDRTAAFVQSDNVVVSPPSGSGSKTTTTTPTTTPASTAQSTSTTTSSTSTISSSTSSVTTAIPRASSTLSSSSTSVITSPTSSLPDNSTPSPTQRQPSMSADRSIPYIIGIISGIVALVVVIVVIRFLLKRRRRRQEATALAARQMTYWNPKPDSKGGFDVEQGSSGVILKDKKKDSSLHGNISPSDRASTSSEDLLLQRSATGAILPLHVTPVGRPVGRPQPHLRPGTSNPSPEVRSPMLPNPFADYSTVPYKNANDGNSNSVGKTLRSSEALKNARASSVFLPSNDQYEDIELDAGPSTSGADGSRSLAQAQPPHAPPSSWKVGQIVSQQGELMPSPTPTNAPKSAHPVYGQSSFRSAYSARTNSSNGHSASSTPRGTAPASPSPFDDVVFDLGALPPQTITPLGRTVSTNTTRVRRRVGNGTPSGERSPAGNFPADANDDVDDFEYDVPTSRNPSAHSVASTSKAGASGVGRPQQYIPPVPPLNLGKVTANVASQQDRRQQYHSSAIPSPPHDPADFVLADLPTVPTTAQSDGEYVRSMFADVFGPGIGDEEREREHGATSKITLTPNIDPRHPPRGDNGVRSNISTTRTNDGSPPRRPRADWI